MAFFRKEDDDGAKALALAVDGGGAAAALAPNADRAARRLSHPDKIAGREEDSAAPFPGPASVAVNPHGPGVEGGAKKRSGERLGEEGGSSAAGDLDVEAKEASEALFPGVVRRDKEEVDKSDGDSFPGPGAGGVAVDSSALFLGGQGQLSADVAPGVEAARDAADRTSDAALGAGVDAAANVEGADGDSDVRGVDAERGAGDLDGVVEGSEALPPVAARRDKEVEERDGDSSALVAVARAAAAEGGAVDLGADPRGVDIDAQRGAAGKGEVDLQEGETASAGVPGAAVAGAGNNGRDAPGAAVDVDDSAKDAGVGDIDKDPEQATRLAEGAVDGPGMHLGAAVLLLFGAAAVAYGAARAAAPFPHAGRLDSHNAAADAEQQPFPHAGRPDLAAEHLPYLRHDQWIWNHHQRTVTATAVPLFPLASHPLPAGNHADTAVFYSVLCIGAHTNSTSIRPDRSAGT